VAGESGVSAGQRLRRLVGTRSPGTALRAARRELVWRRREAAVARAARSGRRLLVGPFLGEVGYELLYWIPTVRRLLSEQRVRPELATVLARGGAASWYGDVAGHSVEILDLIPPEDYLPALVERRRRGRGQKQYFPDALDSRLVRLARERIGDAEVVHPLLMYSRLRFVLEGLRPPEDAPRLADYRQLDWQPAPLPPDCPDDFVAVKLYFSEPFPDRPESRRLAERILAGLPEETDVVVLTSGVQLDEHREWIPTGRRIHDASRWVTPQDNLRVQTGLVARARAFMCTYGGFSYLGPMLGVPTLALQVEKPYSAVHLAVLRAAFPDADYAVVGPGDAEAATGFAARAVGGAA
jgi:hypothetical protein